MEIAKGAAANGPVGWKDVPPEPEKPAPTLEDKAREARFKGMAKVALDARKTPAQLAELPPDDLRRMVEASTGPTPATNDELVKYAKEYADSQAPAQPEPAQPSTAPEAKPAK